MQSVVKNRDHPRNQLVQFKNQVSVLGKKIKIQKTDLRMEHKQNQVLKQELVSVKVLLQSAKQQGACQRAEHQRLKEQLKQVSKERDSLNDKWLCCQHECSELCDSYVLSAIQQSSFNRKDSECKEQTRAS